MSCRFILLGIASFFVICSLHAANAASLNKRSQNIAEGRSLRSAIERAYRQFGEDPAEEESDEDDDEYDAEQAQQEILRNQQAQEESQEDSEEDDDDNDRRRRRDVSTDETGAPVRVVLQLVEAVKPVEEEAVKPVEDKKEDDKEDDKKEEEAIAAAASSLPVRKPPSVLILIRDALKKVTAELPQPTQQVATSALQYFQLFEHFLQQTIEQVIGDDDDDEEEVTTVKAEVEAGSVEVSENKKPDAVEAPLPIPAPAPATAPAPSLATIVQEVAEVIAEQIKPVVVPQQIDVPKIEVVVSEVVASNKA